MAQKGRAQESSEEGVAQEVGYLETGLGMPWQLPHQAAIGRGVGIAMTAGAFGLVTSIVAGGRTPRQVLLPTAMNVLFWGLFVGLTTYASHKNGA